ncbi:MAG TPA: hypothetical protein P5571_11000 [Candidatus Krumholzibacteria bacterium]|nr:hypothetical protein [Candidatus Krumholzibacteria bacterium]HRX51883.1 hypothetical protein [Candidatus Krumholzibacteria bacterium]
MSLNVGSPSSGERNFECIEPDLGAQTLLIDDPATDSELKSRLTHHVAHCADCRLRVALARDMAAGLRSGLLQAPEDGTPAWVRWTGGLGGLALAASLALVFLLPPSPPGSGRIQRGADDPHVTAPVADSVIRDRTPVLRWTPVDRATGYRVSVREVGGGFVWEAETSTPEIGLPAAAVLPPSSRLRVDVEPVPGHLVRGGRLQSSFRTGSWDEYLPFRFGAAPRVVLAGALAGLAGLVVGLFGLMRGRP